VAAWTKGKKTPDGPFPKKPSRETAADIIHAIATNTPFSDVVNTVNVGQVANLPMGAVVETMGYVDATGFRALTAGPLPEPIRAAVAPHAQSQLNAVSAGLSGNLEDALQALIADPICAHLPPSDVRKMGMELLEANREYLGQFFGG